MPNMAVPEVQLRTGVVAEERNQTTRQCSQRKKNFLRSWEPQLYFPDIYNNFYSTNFNFSVSFPSKMTPWTVFSLSPGIFLPWTMHMGRVFITGQLKFSTIFEVTLIILEYISINYVLQVSSWYIQTSYPVKQV